VTNFYCLTVGHDWRRDGVGVGSFLIVWSDFVTCNRCGETMHYEPEIKDKTV
jgi:hypothetical protein